MAYNFKETDVMSGSFGILYIDGREVANVSSFKSEGSYKSEEVKLTSGQIGSKNVGVSVEIKVTLQKVFSLEHDILNSIKKGRLNPRVTLNGQLDDPEALGAEAVAFNDCGFKDKFNILSFVRGELSQTEFTLTCIPDNIDILESVEYI